MYINIHTHVCIYIYIYIQYAPAHSAGPGFKHSCKVQGQVCIVMCLCGPGLFSFALLRPTQAWT